MDNVLFAFLLTLFAGLATGIGSLIAFLSRDFNKKFLGLSLGFSAGVMLYVSFIEIFMKSQKSLLENNTPNIAYLYTTLAFFGGMLVIYLIDKIIPSFDYPESDINIDLRPTDTLQKQQEYSQIAHRKLFQMGIFSAIAIAIHNFPEGLATFMGALSDPAIGISLAIAIAIHNIPEGIAVSLPIYYATRNRKKAFIYSFASGLTEPIGALIGYFLLSSYLTPTTFGIIFAGVAGIMVYISLDKLLPEAEEHSGHTVTMIGLFSGMAVMATSLVLFMFK
jgi:ZIP family zinc transporter